MPLKHPGRAKCRKISSRAPQAGTSTRGHPGASARRAYGPAGGGRCLRVRSRHGRIARRRGVQWRRGIGGAACSARSIRDSERHAPGESAGNHTSGGGTPRLSGDRVTAPLRRDLLASGLRPLSLRYQLGGQYDLRDHHFGAAEERYREAHVGDSRKGRSVHQFCVAHNVDAASTGG